jgi:hypothetical protein
VAGAARQPARSSISPGGGDPGRRRRFLGACCLSWRRLQAVLELVVSRTDDTALFQPDHVLLLVVRETLRDSARRSKLVQGQSVELYQAADRAARWRQLLRQSLDWSLFAARPFITRGASASVRETQPLAFSDAV